MKRRSSGESCCRASIGFELCGFEPFTAGGVAEGWNVTISMTDSTPGFNLLSLDVRSGPRWRQFEPKCNQPLSRSSFASDPLPDIQRAIVDSCPLRFVDREKFYRLALRQADVLEIEDQCTTYFLFQHAPKRVHVLPCNPPTDTQEHTILSDCPAVDAAVQSDRPSGVVGPRLLLQRQSACHSVTL